MLICHISDTHSKLPQLSSRAELIVHSGDFYPNNNISNRNQEAVFQMNWLQQNIPMMKQWLNNRPFLFTSGNHDFVDPNKMEAELQLAGINAINLNNKLVSYQNINFYGFPYVNYMSGRWNYELRYPEMQLAVDNMVDVLNAIYVDVLVCHSPIYGALDMTYGGDHVGLSELATALNYKINKEMLPGYYFAGHIHESHGLTMRNSMLISNAATVTHLIEI